MSTGGEMRALRRLAASHGIQPFYRDVEWTRRDAAPEALLAALRALGEEVESAADAPDALEARRHRLARRAVEPVCVAWRGEAGATVRVTAPGGDAVEWRLDTEEGRIRTWRGRLDRLPRVGEHAVGGRRCTTYRVPLPDDVPAGYHRLSVRVRDAGEELGGESLLIVAPRRAHGGPADGDDRRWGAFLPVHAIRRDGGPADNGAPSAPSSGAPAAGPADWGVGDLTGLEELGRWVSERGGSTVATLPLLSAFLYGEPFEYSPYAPASRLFWNELFVDPARLPELERSSRARQLLESEELHREAADLAAGRLVDYRRTAALKRRVLEPLAAAFFAEDAPEARRDALEALRERRPELDAYAAFRAAGERFGAPWQDWPRAAREGELDGDEVDGAARRYHLYAQLAAEEQVRRAGRALSASGGLYLDLPLGVHPSSFDVWRERELFATGASAGAPPDPFFTQGQDWGFHPLHPERLREQGYRHLVAVLRHHLRHAGILRIDHVMQLHRLFWIPRGVEKSEGVYVRYPARELYAVLSLESHRAEARLVGENLGTVPPSVNRALARHGIAKMFVLPFEVDEAFSTGRLHRPVPDDAVAAVNTHDMPTFRAFWEGADLDDRRDLGLLEEGEAQREARRRERTRELWVRGLTRSGHLRPGEGEREVLKAALASMAESESPLVLVNLEDLWGEIEPQNVPGTWRERPNWRRRAALTLRQIATHPDVLDALRRVDAARRADRGGPAAAAPPTAAPPSPTEHPAEHPQPSEGRTPVTDRSPDRPDTADTADTASTTATAPAPEPPADAPDMLPVDEDRSLLTEDDLFLFNEGRHFRLYERMGARRRTLDGEEGYNFAVWAPDAERVTVAADFNGWNRDSHPLTPRGASGIWEGFVPGVEPGAHYKFHVRSRFGDYRVDKADPFAVRSEEPPKTGSVLWHLDHEWGDDEWMAEREGRIALDAPVSVYELHPGSWRRVPEEGDRYLTYREMAEPLADHCEAHGFTHVELLPVMEHPFYGSWGYQTTGYFAPTARYGTPQDLMAMIDYLHRRGIGVILDWVPSHFPSDEHGLGYFDGTHLFEHSDPREGYHPDWNSFIFNYGRHEVRSFLISSALYWLDRYHVDGLRVDAVASMLYRDYSRQEGEWVPNVHGGRENLEAIEFLRQLNTAVYEHFPGVQTFAEESTSWPGVSRPTYVGGLGFGYKWDMGWMHDTLQYVARESVHRKFHQNELTFRSVYAWSENFTLPLSHDEVVHGKRSLLAKMPGDDWQKLANLRLLYGYMWAQPGKKLLFMGGELGQWREWSHESSLDWHLLEEDGHRGISRWVADLNRLYRDEPALHELDCDPAGFEWVDTSDHENSSLAFLRRGRSTDDWILAAFNFTPVPRPNYRLGVPRGGRWNEVLNGDAPEYGGSGQGNLGGVDATPTPLHGRSHSVTVTLPPLSAVFFKSGGDAAGEDG